MPDARLFHPERRARVAMERLRQRADFLAASGGRKAQATAFIVQLRQRDDAGPPRVGFTVSRKVGNAVERNRVRRRLREVVRHGAPTLRAGADYVLVGRRAALSCPFVRLVEDFIRVLDGLHSRQPSPRGRTAGRAGGGGRRGAG